MTKIFNNESSKVVTLQSAKHNQKKGRLSPRLKSQKNVLYPSITEKGLGLDIEFLPLTLSLSLSLSLVEVQLEAAQKMPSISRSSQTDVKL